MAVPDYSDVLVIGGTGKVGSRVTAGLIAAGYNARLGSRHADPRFDWEDQSTWTAALRGVGAVFVCYAPDMSVPGAADAICAFSATAVENGVQRLVLLSGRGEPSALEGERALQSSGAAWTIVRCSWFAQNFSEGDWLRSVLSGEVALPVGDVREAFVDADDIADVAVAALTDDSHSGQVYELTGPRLMTFAEAVGEIAGAIGREVRYQEITPAAYADGLRAQHIPEPVIGILSYLFSDVLDGRNAQLGDGVQRALGRAPRDFSEFARDAAAAGAWAGQ